MHASIVHVKMGPHVNQTAMPTLVFAHNFIRELTAKYVSKFQTHKPIQFSANKILMFR